MTIALPRPTPIDEFRDITREQFERQIVPRGQPAVLRGLVRDWPVIRAAFSSSEEFAEYLGSKANDEPGEIWVGHPSIEGRFDFTPDFKAYNHDRKLATVTQLTDLLLRQRGSDNAYAIYAGALLLDRHFPGLRNDVPMPLLDPAREMLVSLWLGNRAKTAAHWDLPQNLGCVVAGTRHFTLFPTDQVGNLYVGPLDRTLAGQSHSAVDVDAPDLDRFPRYAIALQVAQGATLQPGDAIYIPSLWWHAVRSDAEISAMVNFWWRDGDATMMTPLLSLLHTLMTLGALPERERGQWRALFDHYAFHIDGNPAEHLPDPARGILARPQPAETLDALKQRLARALAR